MVMEKEIIPFSGVSVVMPTLNCRYLIESQAGEIRRLCAEVGEVIIVDSHSDDGTVEFLESTLQGLSYRVLRRPRGLYAAWNAGIAECAGEWIHIATAGDLLGGGELGNLLEVAKSTCADVVSGIPRFVNTEGAMIEDLPWPIVELFRRRAGEEMIEMSGAELVAFALVHCRPDRQTQSWLGSSASNLYRTSVLKRFPFPTDVGPTGDVLWALVNAGKVRATFCGRRTGRFVVHGKDLSGPGIRDEEISAIYSNAWSEARDWLLENLDGHIHGVEMIKLFEEILEDQLEFSDVILRLRRRWKEVAELQALHQEGWEKVAELQELLQERREKVAELQALLQEVRGKIPRYLRRFVFPKVVKKEGEAGALRGG